jgi:hypothetical protein
MLNNGSEVLGSNPGFERVLGPAADASGLEKGVDLDELPVGAVLEVHTRHNVYHIENRGDGMAVISGHPSYCPEPVLVNLYGSKLDGQPPRMGFLGEGRRMEFRHPVFGLIATSRIESVRKLGPAS